MNLDKILATQPKRTILCDHCCEEIESIYERALCPVCYAAWQRDLEHEAEQQRTRDAELYDNLRMRCDCLGEKQCRELEDEFLKTVGNRPAFEQLVYRRRAKRAERAAKHKPTSTSAF